MDSTLADGWTSSDYLCNYKWTTYSIDITLHPGDNVAVISTNKSRFAIDDIMIVSLSAEESFDEFVFPHHLKFSQDCHSAPDFGRFLLDVDL